MRDCSGIDVFSMFYAVDVYSLRSDVDPIEKAIISDTEAISPILRQFEEAGRACVLGQGADFLEETFKDRSLQLIKVFLSRAEEKDLIPGAF